MISFCKAAFLILTLSPVLLHSRELALSQGRSLGWNHTSELGITLSGGNSDSQSYQAKQKTAYIWQRDGFDLQGHFLFGKSFGVKSAENWSSIFRYEHLFNDILGFVLGHGWEGDKFAGYEYRTHTDAGLKQYWSQQDKFNYTFTEVGYRFQYEKRVPTAPVPNLTTHLLRGFFEHSLNLTPTVVFKFWLEALVDLQTAANYAYNFEPSLNVVLDSNLSLKIAFTGRYDGQPALPGYKNFDYIYTTSLVAQF